MRLVYLMVLLLSCCVPAIVQGAAGNAARKQHRPWVEDDEAFWLQNMAWHRFSMEEMTKASGLDAETITKAQARYHLRTESRPPRTVGGPLLVLPYPGGRHPRIGFLDGAVDPQRETKFSVFPPWDDTSYVVVDLPEALWSNLGLTYLAHTHIPTVFDKQGVRLPPLEWRRGRNGRLDSERMLPNGIAFGASVAPARDAVYMELWLKNGTSMPLSDLRVQTCVMLKGAAGFATQTNANKVFSKPYAACRSDDGRHWVITGWERCDRPWGNAPVPCLHADPKFPDCAPGEIRRLHGWLSFYEGTNLVAELTRLDKLGWQRGDR
jgi:hypothetical protein